MTSGPTATSASLARDDDEKVAGTPPMPTHWTFEGNRYTPFIPFGHPLSCIFGLLCVIGSGHTTLGPLWEVVYPGCPTDSWKDVRDSMKKRIQHINILAGLLLAAETSFCTTDPPAGGKFLPYTKTAAYFFIIGATLGTLLGLWVGSTVVFVLHEVEPQWFREIMMGSRLRVWLATLVMALPSLCIICSASSLALGLTVAATYSEFTYLKIIPCIFVALAVLTTWFFVWMTIAGHRGPQQYTRSTSV